MMDVQSPPFLVWYDDNPKITVTQKIEAAIAAYGHRFRGVQPTLVLVNEAEVTELQGVEVRSATNVRRHTYWVGLDEQTAASLPSRETGPLKPVPASRRKK